MKTIQINVIGRVQGVYFRADTKTKAIELDITGFVKNNQDGSVQIIARSDQDKLNGLINWCHKGPIMAKVSKVIVNEYTTKETFIGFEVR